MQLSAVLGHALVSDLDKSKLDIDDLEQILDLGTELGFQGFKPPYYLSLGCRSL